MNALPMLFRCRACGVLLRMTSPKAFSAKIRRHRAKYPTHRKFTRLNGTAH